MVKLIKDAFGIVKQFTSIFSSTECVCNCLPTLNHAKYLEHAFFTGENAPTWREPFANKYYNVALALVLSHSVCVSVLKISIVLTDSVSIAWANRFARIFFARAAVVCEGENIIFRDNNWYKQRLCPPVPKRRQFCDLFSWAKVLKWGRKREKQRKRRFGISAVTIHFTEQSLLILLSVFRVGFDAQFHRLCYKTIGSCF